METQACVNDSLQKLTGGWWEMYNEEARDLPSAPYCS